MQHLLLILQILVAVGLVTLVLLQHGKGADAGAAFGGGSSGSMFGSRGPATLLTRATAVLAAVFFVNSIALAYMSGQGMDRRSVVERVEVPGTGVPIRPDDVPTLGAPPQSAPADVPGPSGEGG